jgi:hypothetical protein
MAKLKEDLYLFEALELRTEYDRKIALLKSILGSSESSRDIFSIRSEADKKDFDDDFDLKKSEQELKGLETRRVKLNQAIQATNFTATLAFKDSTIPLAEALEVRKGLLNDIEALGSKVKKSVFKEIVHKEERDIVHRPRYRFGETYREYGEKLEDLRTLNSSIHRWNHSVTVTFKDEKL